MIATTHLVYYCCWKLLCYCCWKYLYYNICFTSIKPALIKRYHLHMCNSLAMVCKVAAVKYPCKQNNFGKRYEISRLLVNCHENRTTFQSRLRFQTGLCSLWVSCKHALKYRSVCWPRLEEFNIVSNNHERTQKCNFCVSVRKSNFTDHHTPNTIHSFRYSVLVCKLHDCMMHKNFEHFHSFPSSDGSHYNG